MRRPDRRDARGGQIRKMGKVTGKSDHAGALAPLPLGGRNGGTSIAKQESNGFATGPSRGAEGFAPARRLIAVANELLALAAELEDVAQNGSIAPLQTIEGLPDSAPILLEDDARWLRWARRAYRDRRSRSAIFGDEGLFGEPAWDLLLDLFIAAKERKRVPVTSACIGAAVPTTTALRWLTVLEERGLVVREADTADARRIFVRLSTDAYARMVRYFARITMNEADDTVELARSNGRMPERAGNHESARAAPTERG